MPGNYDPLLRNRSASAKRTLKVHPGGAIRTRAKLGMATTDSAPAPSPPSSTPPTTTPPHPAPPTPASDPVFSHLAQAPKARIMFLDHETGLRPGPTRRLVIEAAIQLWLAARHATVSHLVPAPRKPGAGTYAYGPASWSAWDRRSFRAAGW